MATMLRPSRADPPDRATYLELPFDRPLPGSGANAARRLERACHVLAQLIDISLTAAFLIADVALAGTLLLTIAGQALA